MAPSRGRTLRRAAQRPGAKPFPGSLEELCVKGSVYVEHVFVVFGCVLSCSASELLPPCTDLTKQFSRCFPLMSNCTYLLEDPLLCPA